MTEKDYDDAGNALIDWFKTQGISPANGSIIMLKLIAIQLVAKSRICEIDGIPAGRVIKELV